MSAPPRTRPILIYPLDPATFQKDADYFYICENNTIYGTKFAELPETGNVPLVADLSSCILSEPIDVTRYGVIFCRRSEEYGPGGGHSGHHPRGPDRPLH